VPLPARLRQPRPPSWENHTLVAENIYQQLGAGSPVMIKEGAATRISLPGDPHTDPDFILPQFAPASNTCAPPFAGSKFHQSPPYYGVETLTESFRRRALLFFTSPAAGPGFHGYLEASK